MTNFSMAYTTQSAEETMKAARDIMNTLFEQKEHILCLHGELGAGKTTLVKGIAKTLSIESLIKSPTYTYVNSYPLSALNSELSTLHHFDLYRLPEDTHTFPELEELLDDKSNLIVIEWAERLQCLKNMGLHINLKKTGRYHQIAICS
jgi:tRNA threonylcarbamoyladenosine biosynthesis protein TsaE